MEVLQTSMRGLEVPSINSFQGLALDSCLILNLRGGHLCKQISQATVNGGGLNLGLQLWR